MRDIVADEELLVNYSMNLGDSPEWYRIVWIKHHREFKKCSDVTIKRLLQRYTENSLKHVEIPESEELNIPEPHGKYLCTYFFMSRSEIYKSLVSTKRSLFSSTNIN